MSGREIDLLYQVGLLSGIVESRLDRGRRRTCIAPGGISPVLTLNNICPKFRPVLLPSTMKNDMEPFTIIPLQDDEATVTAEGSWYDHKSMAIPLFKQRDLQ